MHLEFQVCTNSSMRRYHYSTSKLQLNIINYHTLYNNDVNSKQTGHINLGLFYILYVEFRSRRMKIQTVGDEA
jgi:hypothetical protein